MYKRLRGLLRTLRVRFIKNRFYRSRRNGPVHFLRYIGSALVPRPHRISPESVVQKMEKKGVTQRDIGGSHLDFVYRTLRPMLATPPARDIGVSIASPGSPSGSSESLWGVIVEPRPHPHLAYVVNNVHETLGIPIQIFHGRGEKEFIMGSEIGRLVNKGHVSLSELSVNTLPNGVIAKFLLSEEYWHAMHARNRLLFFQTDSLVCKNSDYSIEDFSSFAYIGSKWKSHRPNRLIIRGGSGGISLRDWKASVECIKRFPYDLWEGASDEYFAFHLPIMGCKVGNAMSCAKFATEEIFFRKSFAAHRIDRLPPEDLENFLDYCPEARPLIQDPMEKRSR